MSSSTQWFAVRKPLAGNRAMVLTVFSFLFPLLLWSLVSYVPFLWHPKIEITEPASISWFQPGMLVDRDVFAEQQALSIENALPVPEGDRANPVYLPAPHEVAVAFYSAFTTETKRRSEK